MALNKYERTVLLLMLAELSILPSRLSAFVVSPSLPTTSLVTNLHQEKGSRNKPPSFALGSSPPSRQGIFDYLFDDEVDKVFAKYDVDASGAIDKDEFRDVVRKMKVENSRREVISVATATFGGIWVASASNTFQFGQKKLRQKYLEPLAEEAQLANFPTALLSVSIDRSTEHCFISFLSIRCFVSL